MLREFSDILRELVREADLAARWAGDEFALVLPNTDAEGAAVLLERIRSTLEHRKIRVDGQTITISASFGVAMFPQEASAAGSDRRRRRGALRGEARRQEPRRDGSARAPLGLIDTP